MGQAWRQTVSEVSKRLQNERWWRWVLRRLRECRASKGTVSEVSESEVTVSEVAMRLSWAQPFSTLLHGLLEAG